MNNSTRIEHGAWPCESEGVPKDAERTVAAAFEAMMKDVGRGESAGVYFELPEMEISVVVKRRGEEVVAGRHICCEVEDFVNSEAIFRGIADLQETIIGREGWHGK